MLSKDLEEALNIQLKWEFYSAYLYLSMASYFDNISLEGFANWMKAQAVEENMHAMKFYNFINRRGGKVILSTIEAPPNDWKSPMEVINFALKHEQEVSRRINDLTELAKNNNDHATYIFLQWFITEQLEEEESLKKILDRINLVKESSQGLFILDRELAQRVIDFNLLLNELKA